MFSCWCPNVRGGGVKPVGTKSQVWPKILSDGSPYVTWKIVGSQSHREWFRTFEKETREGTFKISCGSEEQGEKVVDWDAQRLPLQAILQYEEENECC